MTQSFEREHRVAVEAVRTATTVCRRIQAGIANDVLQKHDCSPVTVADFSSQALICRQLAAEFPDDPIVGEEDSSELRRQQNVDFSELIVDEFNQLSISSDLDEICGWIDRGRAEHYSDRFWTLDPIDGTKGFLRGEQYAISLALIVEGKIKVGVLGCPKLPLQPNSEQPCGAMFFAIRGQGSYVMPFHSFKHPVGIRVSQTDDFSDIQLCESVESAHTAHDRSKVMAQDLGVTRPAVRMDSQAKYAVVARGEADVYLRLPTRDNYYENIWDHAAGVLIVEEAGGTVTDANGELLDFTHGRELVANRGVIVTNGLLHDRVLEAAQTTRVLPADTE